MWPDNRIARDAHYLYRYDRHGRLTEKTDLIPEGVIRTDDERAHRYRWTVSTGWCACTRTQYAEACWSKAAPVRPAQQDDEQEAVATSNGINRLDALSRKPQVGSPYGWDGDRLTTIQNDRTRIQTIYQAGELHATHQG